MLFRDYLKEKFKDEDIIEFGPLNRPLFTKEESSNIKYADIRSTEEIKKLYTGNDYLNKTGISIDINSIVDVDYKVEGSYVDTFKDKKFSVAYLSHVIEHMPDLVNFFIDIERVLKEDGRLAIIYPDKRYCFDHFRNSVSFRDAYATYKYGIKENARIAFDFGYNVVHENNPELFWKGENLINVISKNNLEDAEKYYEGSLNGSILDGDVHFWPFSDIDFLKFIYEMKRANLFKFDVEEFYPTQENTQEFMIILKKSDNNDCSKILEYINQYDEQLKENNYKLKIKEDENEIINLKQCIEEKENQLQDKLGELESKIVEIKTKNNEIENLNNEIKNKNNEVENLNNEIKTKNNEVENLNNEIKTKNNEIENLNTKIDTLKEYIQQQSIGIKNLKICINEQSMQLQGEMNKSESKNIQINQLNEEIIRINQSKSMRLTAPLRKFAVFVNKGNKRN